MCFDISPWEKGRGSSSGDFWIKFSSAQVKNLVGEWIQDQDRQTTSRFSP